MRKLLPIICRVSFAISLISTIYLLFIFGHTEVAPLSHVIAAATVAAVSALVGGILQWAGIPSAPQTAPRKKAHK
ncbi:MAG: hypothetical protein K1Y02_05175 [Candidatus Hydrogenedentes bacterium]|nr:hypothetical protein [Candidatus Hydrogenedentota bacterium]